MSAESRNAIGVALFKAMRARLPASHATTDNLTAFLDAVLEEMPQNQTPPSETKTEQRLKRAEEEVEAWRQRVATFVNRRAVYGDDHKRTIEAMDALDDALDGFDPARYESAKDVPADERHARLPATPPNQTDDLPEGIICVFVQNLEVHGLRADGTEVRIRRGG